MVFPRAFHCLVTNVMTPVTYQSESPRWLDRRSRHRIWLKDITPYVFCDNYKKKHQMRKHGEFEIYFIDRHGNIFPLITLGPDLILQSPQRQLSGLGYEMFVLG
jgi:hypothetical protein